MARPKGSTKVAAKRDTLCMRIDSRTKFLLSFAARKERRSSTNVMTCALSEFLESLEYSPAVLRDIWNPNPKKTFLRFAEKYPEMLTHEERIFLEILSRKMPAGLMSKIIADKGITKDEETEEIENSWAMAECLFFSEGYRQTDINAFIAA